jgi:cell division protein FtsZ
MDTQEIFENAVRMKIVGVGGAGNNAVDRIRMDMEQLDGLSLACVNTDLKTLSESPVGEKHLIGRNITRGLGTGGDPELGQKAAESDRELITRMVDGFELIFIVASLGGGTGAGISPVIAEIAKQHGSLVIAFVNMPFTFEGERRFKMADAALKELRGVADAVIPLPNDMLLQEEAAQDSVLNAFSKADEWITRGVKSIWSILLKSGLINVNFSTLREVFNIQGAKTLFGFGQGHGPNFIQNALDDLVICPLLHVPDFSKVADNLLVNVVGGTDLSMSQVQEIMNFVTEKFGSRENTVFGAVIDEGKTNTVEICVIGTTEMGGFRGVSKPRNLLSPQRTPVVANRPTVTAKSLRDQITAGVARKNGQMDLIPTIQQELGFEGVDEHRGFFEETGRNEHDGFDLDVPTYLRRGIRVVLR